MVPGVAFTAAVTFCLVTRYPLVSLQSGRIANNASSILQACWISVLSELFATRLNLFVDQPTHICHVTFNFHEPQRKRSRRAFLCCSNFGPGMPVTMKSPTYAASRAYVIPRPSVEKHQTVGSVRVLCLPHRRQEPVNREPPTPWRIAKSIHSFREFHRRFQRYAHGTRDFAKCSCVYIFFVLHLVSIAQIWHQRIPTLHG